jgi:hypothetical protein
MKEQALQTIERILFEGTDPEKIELFCFNDDDTAEIIYKKFQIFARYFFIRYFQNKQAPKHKELIMHYIKAYLGEYNFMIRGFRGCAKTSLLKLFMVYVLACDKRKKPSKYMKILCRDISNAKQITTDTYNMLVEVMPLFGDFFEKEGDKKREETMGGFTLKGDRKFNAGSVGQDQRGKIQDAFRPDFVWFDDIEDRTSVSSQAITQAVIEKIEEALDGMSPDGKYVCTANYIAEYGSVGYLSGKDNIQVMDFPILEDEKPTWEDRFSFEKCMEIKKNAYDWHSEYMIDPAKSTNKFFDIDKIDEDIKNSKPPIEESAGVKYWAKYVPHHRYGMGSDHSEGVGLDSNTLAVFDFTTGELVASYANNKISPDLSAHEFARVGREYGNCIYAPETNNRCGGIVITTLKNINYPNIYKQRNDTKSMIAVSDKLGWDTNRLTKTTMFMDFRRDYNDGLIKIYDKEILKEMRAYSNDDLTDEKAGLLTRHFDALIAVVIGWAMNKHAYANQSQTPFIQQEEPSIYSDIGL